MRSISSNSGYVWLLVFIGLNLAQAPCLTGEVQETTNEVIYTGIVSASANDSEFQLSIRALAPGTSWEQEGRECAMLRVRVDGQYDHHVFLVGGSQEMQYESIIGPLSAGEHVLSIAWDRSWRPAMKERPEIRNIVTKALLRSDPASEEILRAPILHIRKDTAGRFSDLPLLFYWDIETMDSKSQVTYTVILTNEDGGTNTERLMARWGRTADIEWFYAYAKSPRGILDAYQARDHKTLPFRGRYQGWHPILYDATLNNNFADSPSEFSDVRVRLVPVHARLNGRSRESVLDRFPWIYAIMAQEMTREKKLEDPGDPSTARVSDLRNYAYLDLCVRLGGTELYFELQIKSSDRWFRSDHGDPKARIDRSGCIQSTVELPPGTRVEDLRSLRIQCVAAPPDARGEPVASPYAELTRLDGIFLLQPDYRPGRRVMVRDLKERLKPGQSAIVAIDAPSGTRPSGR